MKFTEAFLVYCLLEDSPSLDDDAWAEIARNHGETARNGRDPALRLIRSGREVGLRDWAQDIVRNVRAIAELIDAGDDGGGYVNAVDAQSALIDDPDATPSARVLDEMPEA